MSVEQQVKTLAFAYVLTFFIVMVTAYAVLSSLVVIRNKCANYREPFGLTALSFTVGAMTNMLMPACCMRFYWKCWTGALLFSIGCYILNKMICFRKAAVGMIVNSFLEKIRKIKSKLLYAEQWFAQKRWFLYVVLGFASGMYIFAFNNDDPVEGSYIFATLCFVGLYFLWLIPAQRSCRWILAILILGPLLAYNVLEPAIGAEIPLSEPDPVLTKVFLRLMFFLAFWIVTALLADEKPVKLALLVVNTATTLLALGINIFAPYLETEILSQAGEQIMSGAVSAYFNGMIFPLVGAGYLSLLIKEAQVYLEEKRAVKDCKENAAQI